MVLTPASSVFRKSAVDRLASPEQLDELVRVAGTSGWIAALGLAVVSAAAIAWGFLGSIATEVPAQGILVQQGSGVRAAISPEAGVIASLAAKAGDQVETGQIVATIRQTGAERRLASARQAAAEITALVDSRTAALRSEAAALRDNADRRRAAQQRIIRLAEEQTHPSQQTQADLASAFARLADIDFDLLSASNAAQRELSELTQKAAEARRQAAEATAALAGARDILAPTTGRVIEVMASEGQAVTANAPVITVEATGHQLQAVVYVPTEHGKKLAPGMTAHIALSTVKKEEWGTLLGHVASVASFPATPQGMAAVLQNPLLVQSFGNAGPPYEARIDLKPADTPTGYTWTSGPGPSIDLTSGTTLRALITVRQEPPINLILPLLRQATGTGQ